MVSLATEMLVEVLEQFNAMAHVVLLLQHVNAHLDKLNHVGDAAQRHAKVMVDGGNAQEKVFVLLDRLKAELVA